MVSVLLGSHVSAPLVIIGIMHVSSIFQMYPIVSIWIGLKFSSPAVYNVVCRAASVFFSSSFRWSLICSFCGLCLRL